IVHHRFISLFYRAWEKTHFYAAYERGKPDRLSEHVADLVGIGVPDIRKSLPVDAESLMFHAGLLAPQQRSATALEQLIGDHLDVQVQLVLKADDVPPCRLGDDDGEPLALGWYTWLHTRPQMSRDPDDTVLSL